MENQVNGCNFKSTIQNAAKELVSGRRSVCDSSVDKIDVDQGTFEVARVELGKDITPPSDSDLAAKQDPEKS